MRLFRFNAENVSKQRESQGSWWKIRRIPFVQKTHHEESGNNKKQQSPQIEQSQTAEPHCEAEKEQSEGLISIICSIIRLELERGWSSADSQLRIMMYCMCESGDTSPLQLELQNTSTLTLDKKTLQSVLTKTEKAVSIRLNHWPKKLWSMHYGKCRNKRKCTLFSSVILHRFFFFSAFQNEC